MRQHGAALNGVVFLEKPKNYKCDLKITARGHPRGPKMGSLKSPWMQDFLLVNRKHSSTQRSLETPGTPVVRVAQQRCGRSWQPPLVGCVAQW